MARKKKVRLQDIAETTGYSISTVSHVINRTRNVDQNTKQIILKALDELGYQLPSKRNQFAQSKTIGVIIADIRVDYFTELVKELEDIAYEHGFHIVVMDSEENPEKERYSIEKLINDGVSGIILAPCNTQANLSFCAHFPIVQVDRMIDAELFDFVGIDNMRASYEITKSLLDQETKEIGLITFADHNYCARERGKGYRLAMLEASRYREEHTLIISYDGDTNHVDISQFLTDHPQLDTLLCTSSNICYEVLCEINRLGDENHIKHVCTFDNNKWLDHVAFPVDAISQPITDIAYTAIDLLLEQMPPTAALTGKKRILLASSIVGRSSLFFPLK